MDKEALMFAALSPSRQGFGNRAQGKLFTVGNAIEN